MDLSIIIINWRSVDYVRKCLASIYAHAGDLKYEVIIVDNASYDGCEQMVNSEFPSVQFYQSTENLGFGRANNLAFARSRGAKVLFLNPDTEIRNDALQKLMSTLESNEMIGMVGARLLNSDLSLQTTCIAALPSILNQVVTSAHLRRAFPKWRIWGMRPLFEDRKEPAPVEAISGACMMAKRPVIEQVGGFTADYFMYSEDMDLCLKVVRAGWKIYYVPDATIVHHAAGSSSSRQENNFSSIMLRESLTRFMELHQGRLYAIMFRSSTAVVAACRIALLLAAFPITLHPKGCRFLCRAFRKWCNIFAWSVGLMPWVSQQQLRPRSSLNL